MTIQMIEINKLIASPANPRKIFDEAQIASLSESIKTDGLLQNLVVLKTTHRKKDKYTIISGERRYRAMQNLIEAGDMPEDLTIPAEVKTGLSEDEALRVATVENIQRENLSPLEEAEALKLLSRDGSALDEICAQTGLSASTIKRRLSLLNLSEDAKEQMQSGAISLAQAEALSLASHEKQKHLLQGIASGWHTSAQCIKDEIIENCYSVAHAIFPKERYSGTITTDLFAEDETSYFDDESQFLELQTEAAQKLVEDYQKSHEWAEFIEGYFYSYEYDEAPAGEKGGVMVCLLPSGAVEIHEGLVKTAVHETVKEKRPKATYSKPLCEYMAAHKSVAMQADLIKNPRTALEVQVASMLERGRYHECLSYLSKSDNPGAAYETVNNEVREVLEILGHDSKDHDWSDLVYLCSYDVDAFELVQTLSDQDLNRVFTLLITLQIEQRNMCELDTYKNSFFNRLAADLEIYMNAAWVPCAEFFKRRNKDQLAAIIKDSGASGKFTTLSNYKKGEIVERLAAHFAESRKSKKPNRDQKKALKWLPEAMQFPAINPDENKEA